MRKLTLLLRSHLCSSAAVVVVAGVAWLWWSRRSPRRLIADHHSLLGCRLRAARTYALGDTILEEFPVVKGHCIIDRRCPGCAMVPCRGAPACVWPVALADRNVIAAIEWHASLCARAPAKGSPGHANWIRVCCLLAVVIQACARPQLWHWLMKNLDPCFDATDDDEVVVRSTRAFARDFAERLAAPAGVQAGSEAAWQAQLVALLLRLQANLFYLDSHTIGFFQTAHRLEHACQPNAAVVIVARLGRLRVRALSPVAAGDAVSFNYLAGGLRHGGATTATKLSELRFDERRKALKACAGFVCRCAACVAEEREWSAKGRAAARARLAEKRRQESNDVPRGRADVVRK